MLGKDSQGIGVRGANVSTDGWAVPSVTNLISIVVVVSDVVRLCTAVVEYSRISLTDNLPTG